MTLFVILVLALTGQALQKLDPLQTYKATKSNAVRYDVDFRIIVTAPQGTKQLRVWVPIPQNDLGQQLEGSTWETFPIDVKPSFHKEDVFGNRFAYFEINNPQGGQIITHRFRATVWQLDWHVDAGKVQRVNTWPEAFAPYQRSEHAIMVDDRIKKLSAELARHAKGPTEELAAIMAWISNNLTYDHSATSLIANAEHALTKKRGDCSDYHGLCSSLGRALGVPTRLTYGINLFPKNAPSHCKMEAFLPPYGWVSFDVSETQRLLKIINQSKKLNGEAKKILTQAAINRLRQGFRDNTWLLHSKGTDYELAPKASQKVPLIATIYAEADGKPLPLPDPADPTKREFSWMTSYRFIADRSVEYPYHSWRSLKVEK